MIKILPSNKTCEVNLFYKPINLNEIYRPDSSVIKMSMMCTVEDKRIYLNFDIMELVKLLNVDNNFTTHDPNVGFTKGIHVQKLTSDGERLITSYETNHNLEMSFKLYKKTNLEYYLFGNVSFLGYQFDCIAHIHE